VHYCGRACQREGIIIEMRENVKYSLNLISAWSVHSVECKGLKKVAPKIVPDCARLLGLIIMKLNVKISLCT